ncbi:MAG: MASE3 domain-containing protein [Candidatus Humimicrobiaceae bacterium]
MFFKNMMRIGLLKQPKNLIIFPVAIPAFLILLYFLSRYNYLFFHTLVSSFNVLVAVMVFILSNETRKFSYKPYTLFLGNAFIFIAIFEFLHILLHEGMNIFPDRGSNMATQLWVARSYFLAIVFFLAPFFIRRKFRLNILILIYFVITGLLIASIIWYKIFPVCYIEGLGLTKFKDISEYIISLILIGAIVFHYQRRNEINHIKYRFIMAALVFSILSNLSLTLYTDETGFLNVLGHILQIIASYLVFQGIFINDIVAPYKDLKLAYDTTIEGWSKALDLRDKETEGHSLRVTDMTVKLARIVGLGESELIQVHRGALLHDIGKMGIPDNILLKPGPLTDSEWETMRKHPQFAFDLLSSSAYLRQALDIPYCHHEKWDGTGYPRSLKGEQIPLTARIFSVVDVWDALNSDRPYRPAWSYEKIYEHLIEQKEKSFDPAIVDMFLKNVVKCSIS